MLSFLLLIGLLPRSTSAACPAYGNLDIKTSCRTSSNELARKNDFYQNSDHHDSFFTMLQKESLQKVEELQKDPAFQNILDEFQHNASKGAIAFRNPSEEPKGELYIFISFSMGEKALLNIAHEAKEFGGTLVLRGFHKGSYVKTAQSLQNIITKTGQGVIIDPELYSLFAITAVPTYVLVKPFNMIAVERTQTPLHDKLQGHVSVHYALETFAKDGDLKDEARGLLTERTLSKGVSK